MRCRGLLIEPNNKCDCELRLTTDDPAHGVVDQFGAIFEAEFFADVGAMRVHSFDADVQFSGDVVVVFSFTSEAEDFEFTFRQLALSRGTAGAAAGFSECLQYGT